MGTSRGWASALAEPGVARHLVLVGLPGAGKTSVGRALATLLGRPFVDLDGEIERRAGRTIAELFAGEGEGAFRAQEAAVSEAMVGQPAAVIAPGGGWMANPPAVATLRPAARIIYLRVSPATALDRMGPARAARPLLAGSDPRTALEALLARRRALYAVADHTLDTEALSVAEVAESLVAMAAEWERDEG
ncbi:MAG: shikimate kinase [Gemmatirosa sp.]|nr:shikimate kinase [Gemmatirosa sp.]